MGFSNNFTQFLFMYVLFYCPYIVYSQEDQSQKDVISKLKEDNIELNHRLDQLQKMVDDGLWFDRMSDVAFVDKVFMYGPPPAKVQNPTAMGAKNPVKFWSYIFIPKNIDQTKKYPLLVLPHGGVHGDFTTCHFHIIREMMAQGYIVVAPEYRGSTGYGKGFHDLIDYGGLENEDCDASRQYMIQNYDFVDGDRVGIIGWSHGGMIALMNIFNNPGAYKCAFAGVPVSDLVARMGYATDEYRDIMSAEGNIGKTAHEDVNEYRRRSPAWNAEKLQSPLLIHTNTNDDDVNSLEVEHLIQALKAEGKKFEYEIFKDIPGGHSFDRIDSKIAKEIRVKIYKFLALYLNPQKPITSVQDINKAAYLPLK